MLVLIKWIETFHTLNDVNILKCVPIILEKMLQIIGIKVDRNEVGYLAKSQLDHFLKEFYDEQRDIEWDTSIIGVLTKVLGSARKEVDSIAFEALTWLKSFISFFEEDFNLAVQEEDDF